MSLSKPHTPRHRRVFHSNGSRHLRATFVETIVGHMPYAYIVECADGSYYVGSTVDLERRVSEHNLGLGAAYTKHRRPVRLVWAEEHFRVEDAYAVEKRLQGWSRRKRQALISGKAAALPRLSSRSWAARRERDG